MRAPVGNVLRRALPPSSRWALKLVEDYLPQLVAEKGGPENVTFAERAVLETAMVARVCWTLAMHAERPQNSAE